MSALRQLVAKAQRGPWHFNETNHLLVSYEPNRLGFIDSDEDGPLIALAPEMATLLADAMDALACAIDVFGWDEFLAIDTEALLARFAVLERRAGETG